MRFERMGGVAYRSRFSIEMQRMRTPDYDCSPIGGEECKRGRFGEDDLAIFPNGPLFDWLSDRMENFMMNQKSRLILFRLIAVVFVAFIGIPAALAVFIHCETNIYDYERVKSIVTHTPYLYVGIALGIMAVVMGMCAFLERFASHRKEEKRSRG